MLTVDHGTSAYGGPERRRHRVFVTKNSEYHCRDGVCLAVRSRRTGAFQRGHLALGKRVTAGLVLDERGLISQIFEPREMCVGHRMWLSAGDEDPEHEVITSTLHSTKRPAREVVDLYPRELGLSVADPQPAPGG